MPRPALPKAEDVAFLAKVLRAEGFNNIRIESFPDGRLNIVVNEADTKDTLTPLQMWKAQHGAA